MKCKVSYQYSCRSLLLHKDSLKHREHQYAELRPHCFPKILPCVFRITTHTATLAESSLDPSSSHQMPNSGSFLSSADKFNRLPAPESSKQAYLRALRRDPLPPAVVPDSTTLTTETEGGFQRRRSGVASSPGGGPVAAGGAKRGKAGGAGAPSSGPGESYVLLPPPAKQPSLRPSASSTGGQVRSRERTDSSLAAAATTSATPSLARQADDAPSSLFNTLSSHTSIDHPLCEECARGLEQQFIRAREDAILERQAYERWEELVAIGIPGDPSGMGPLSVEEDQESREEEKRMKEELEAMTRDLEILEKEEARLKEDEKTLRQEEVEVEEEEKRCVVPPTLTLGESCSSAQFDRIAFCLSQIPPRSTTRPD